jgi:excisionase family DNA binding protein
MRQAGEYLAVSYWTVRGWVDSGKLSPVRLGERLIRIERADLDRLIETRKEPA